MYSVVSTVLQTRFKTFYFPGVERRKKVKTLTTARRMARNGRPIRFSMLLVTAVISTVKHWRLCLCYRANRKMKKVTVR